MSATSTSKKEFRCHYELLMNAIEMKRGALEIKKLAHGELVAVADVLDEATNTVLVNTATEAIVALLVVHSGGLRADEIGRQLRLPADSLRDALDCAISSGRVTPKGGKRAPVYVHRFKRNAASQLETGPAAVAGHLGASSARDLPDNMKVASAATWVERLKRAIGISPRRFAEIESGRRTITLYVMIRVADLFGYDLNSLVLDPVKTERKASPALPTLRPVRT